MIGEPTHADAILDRLVHNAYRITLKGESMRKANAAPQKPVRVGQFWTPMVGQYSMPIDILSRQMVVRLSPVSATTARMRTMRSVILC